MKVHGNVDLRGQSQILNFRPEILAADPAVEALFEGRGWWNSADKALKFYNGTEVVTLAIGGDLSDYIRADGTTSMTADLLLSSADQSGSEANAAISKGYAQQLLAAKQDTVTGAASTIVAADLTANKAVVSDAQGKVVEGSATAAEVGHLAGVTAPLQGQIDGKQAALGYTPLNKAGDNLEGDINAGGHKISGLGAPVAPTDAARQIDIDNALSGLNWQEDVKGVQVDATLDPGVAVKGDRYIVTDVAALHAGFGTIADVANGDIVEHDGTEFVVVFDVSAEGEKANGTLAWDNDSKTYKRLLEGAWGSFGGLSDINAGAGLEQVGNTLNVRMGAGIVELPEDGVGIDLRAESGLALLDADGAESTAADAKLSVKLDGVTLAKTAAGLKVAAAGIGAAEIAAAALGDGLVGGDGSVLTVKAKNAGGIIVDADGAESTAADAKLSVKLDGPSLAKTAAGLKVAAAGIGAAEIAAAALGDGLVGGDGSVLTVKAKNAGGIVVDAEGVSVDNAKLGETFLAKTGDTAADLKVTAAPVAETDVARLKEVTDAKAAMQVVVDAVKANFDASEVVYDGLATVQTTHTIAHNLNNRYPQVEVVDANGDTVLADVTRVDANNVSVTVAPATGVVVIVRGNKKPV